MRVAVAEALAVAVADEVPGLLLLAAVAAAVETSAAVAATAAALAAAPLALAIESSFVEADSNRAAFTQRIRSGSITERQRFLHKITGPVA